MGVWNRWGDYGHVGQNAQMNQVGSEKKCHGYRHGGLGMLDEYAGYYSEASQLFSNYGSSLADVSFHGQHQALEVFCLMAISLCESHAKAISLLLKNDCAVEPIIVARSFFEVFCDFYWISQEGALLNKMSVSLDWKQTHIVK